MSAFAGAAMAIAVWMASVVMPVVAFMQVGGEQITPQEWQGVIAAVIFGGCPVSAAIGAFIGWRSDR